MNRLLVFVLALVFNEGHAAQYYSPVERMYANRAGTLRLCSNNLENVELVGMTITKSHLVAFCAFSHNDKFALQVFDKEIFVHERKIQVQAEMPYYAQDIAGKSKQNTVYIMGHEDQWEMTEYNTATGTRTKVHMKDFAGDEIYITEFSNKIIRLEKESDIVQWEQGYTIFTYDKPSLKVQEIRLPAGLVKSPVGVHELRNRHFLIVHHNEDQLIIDVNAEGEVTRSMSLDEVKLVDGATREQLEDVRSSAIDFWENVLLLSNHDSSILVVSKDLKTVKLLVSPDKYSQAHGKFESMVFDRAGERMMAATKSSFAVIYKVNYDGNLVRSLTE